ncbi:hypothetical protein IFO70_10610 [Phormidium tenue FACHB-886]|nr:hypothetical protein [Phormidium tenue FACHB-886]
MVERPIKKSERQQMVEASSAEGSSNAQATTGQAPSGDRAPKIRSKEDREQEGSRDRDRGKGKGKGKGNRYEEEKKPVNMALMRGPRPAQPKAPVEEPPVEELAAPSQASEVTTEVTSEESPEITTEG